MNKKMHCWDIKNCGRQPGGMKELELGVCPASTDARLDGVHGGMNAGRACWVVGGTMCGGEVQGTFAKKYDNCKHCDVYSRIQNEEYPNFKLSAQLLGMLK